MSFQKETPSKISEVQRAYMAHAIEFMKIQGPNEDGTVGFIIRAEDKAVGNDWIDWFWANGYRDAARAVAPMVKQRGGFMVPCKDPHDFGLFLTSKGVEVKEPRRLPAPTKANRAAKIDPALERKTDHSEAAVEVAKEMCRSDIGRKARDEGWLNALFEYCRDTGKYPGEWQQRALRAMAQHNDRLMHDQHPLTQSMATALRERRAAIEEAIFGSKRINDAAE